MTFKVIDAGISVSVQDLGRPGYYQLGIPQGGAMDRFSLSVANLLVGNNENAAGLEAAYIGPKLHFSSSTTIAVTGGDAPVFVDGVEYECWRPIEIKAGQILEFGFIKNGARLYLAFAGGINVPEVLGSRSTYTVGILGGLEGRVLKSDDVLKTFQSESRVTIRDVSIPEAMRPQITQVTSLKVLPGLYWHRLTEDAGEKFFADEWAVGTEADRMGYRFTGGRPMEFVERTPPFGAGADPSNIVDSAYPYGSIQVPAGQEPIVLHRDAVSAGGYFQIGTVISADMDLIGQLQPNKKVQFIKVSMDEALKARSVYQAKMAQVRQTLNR